MGAGKHLRGFINTPFSHSDGFSRRVHEHLSTSFAATHQQLLHSGTKRDRALARQHLGQQLSASFDAFMEFAATEEVATTASNDTAASVKLKLANKAVDQAQADTDNAVPLLKRLEREKRTKRPSAAAFLQQAQLPGILCLTMRSFIELFASDLQLHDALPKFQELQDVVNENMVEEQTFIGCPCGRVGFEYTKRFGASKSPVGGISGLPAGTPSSARTIPGCAVEFRRNS